MDYPLTRKEEVLNHKLFKLNQSRERNMVKRSNRLESKFKVLDAINELKFSSRSSRNHFIFYPNNSDLHEDVKFKIFKLLRRSGYDVFVEAEFKSGGRADLIDASNCIIYEVLGTERDDDCNQKVMKYPDVFEIRKIDAHNPDFNEVDYE